MMKRFLLLCAFFCWSELVYAQENPVALPLVAQVSGTYKGSLPCADCRTIETEVELAYLTDSTGQYTILEKYMGKDKTDVLSIARRTGAYIVVKEVADKKPVTLVMLDYDYPEKTSYYLVKTDGNILPLGEDKQPIAQAADCTLKKVKAEVIEK